MTFLFPALGLGALLTIWGVTKWATRLQVQEWPDRIARMKAVAAISNEDIRHG